MSGSVLYARDDLVVYEGGGSVFMVYKKSDTEVGFDKEDGMRVVRRGIDSESLIEEVNSDE